jgi:aminoglycoside 2''-phosphotransferase
MSLDCLEELFSDTFGCNGRIVSVLQIVIVVPRKVPSWKGKNNKNVYLTQIHEHFPWLKYKKSRTLRHGWDHDVVILDEKYVFRFPKKDYGRRFRAEVRFLHTTYNRFNISVPHYEYVPDDLSFGGYKMIKGKEMIPSGLKRLSEKKKKHIASQLGEFLSVLHEIPVSYSKKAGLKEEKDGYWWSRQRCKKIIRKMRKLLFPKLTKREAQWIEKRYEEYFGCSFDFETVILHGDLSEEHILYNPQKGKITGIIDFADSEIGDPAFDFAFLWQYGEEFVDDVLSHYQRSVNVDIMKRARFPNQVYMATDMLAIMEGEDVNRPFEYFHKKLKNEMEKHYA